MNRKPLTEPAKSAKGESTVNSLHQFIPVLRTPRPLRESVRDLLFLSMLLPGILFTGGCSYSFRGGTVPPHLSTVAIPVVDDVSGYGDPSLRERFTQELTQAFITDASLELADRNTADAVLDGTIVEVRDAPSVLQGGEQVAQRRITVRIRMIFNDLKLRKEVWSKEFTSYGDYPSGGGLTQRQEGIDEAIRKLTEDILNETVAGW